MPTHEYIFDAKLYCVIRVTAESEEDARAAADEICDAMDISDSFLGGYNDEKASNGAKVVVTEASLGGCDREEMLLVAIDGDEDHDDLW